MSYGHVHEGAGRGIIASSLLLGLTRGKDPEGGRVRRQFIERDISA